MKDGRLGRHTHGAFASHLFFFSPSPLPSRLSISQRVLAAAKARFPRCVFGAHVDANGKGSFTSPFGPGTAVFSKRVEGMAAKLAAAGTEAAAARFRATVKFVFVTDLKCRFKWWPKTNSFAKSAIDLSLCSLSQINSGDSGVVSAHISRSLLNARRISATVISGIADITWPCGGCGPPLPSISNLRFRPFFCSLVRHRIKK